MYEPVEQAQNLNATKWLIVRLAPVAAGAPAMVRRALASLDPSGPAADLVPLQRSVDNATEDTRATARLLSAFAAAALLLAAIGIFGVVSYTVATRTREIGLRMAVGAAPADVARWVVLYAGRLSTIGLSIGIVASVVFARLIQHVTFGVSALDVPTFCAAVGVLAFVSVASAVVPAARAAKTDPLVCLASEE